MGNNGARRTYISYWRYSECYGRCDLVIDRINQTCIVEKLLIHRFLMEGIIDHFLISRILIFEESHQKISRLLMELLLELQIRFLTIY
jgi:hypothetical protein